jgi:hypothetical protein
LPGHAGRRNGGDRRGRSKLLPNGQREVHDRRRTVDDGMAHEVVDSGWLVKNPAVLSGDPAAMRGWYCSVKMLATRARRLLPLVANR